jgi:putative transposase
LISLETIIRKLEERYTPLIDSAAAQQIVNKNNEAWKSFLRLEAEGKLPKHIAKVSMPRC